jgi:hypothetical protein
MILEEKFRIAALVFHPVYQMRASPMHLANGLMGHWSKCGRIIDEHQPRIFWATRRVFRPLLSETDSLRDPCSRRLSALELINRHILYTHLITISHVDRARGRPMAHAST